MPLTLERMLGWLMAPLAWLIGIPWAEAVPAGAILGTKTVLNEFLAYLQLAAVPEGESIGTNPPDPHLCFVRIREFRQPWNHDRGAVNTGTGTAQRDRRPRHAQYCWRNTGHLLHRGSRWSDRGLVPILHQALSVRRQRLGCRPTAHGKEPDQSRRGSCIRTLYTHHCQLAVDDNAWHADQDPHCEPGLPCVLTISRFRSPARYLPAESASRPTSCQPDPANTSRSPMSRPCSKKPRNRVMGHSALRRSSSSAKRIKPMRRQEYLAHFSDARKIKVECLQLHLRMVTSSRTCRAISALPNTALKIAIDIHARGRNGRIYLERLPADDGDTGALQGRERPFQSAHGEITPW